MMKAFDLQVDFFLPLWRRIALIVVCLGWAVFEFVAMAPMWGMIFGCMGLYAVWQFFLSGWPEADHTAAENLSPEEGDNEKRDYEKRDE